MAKENAVEEMEVALRAIIAMITAEAAKYSDPSEMDYRHGMQHATIIINEAIARMKASVA